MKYRMSEPITARIGTMAHRCTVRWRAGEFITDEPESMGGHDIGPDPFTLLLSSLSSSTLVTLRALIDEQGWDIPEIAVSTNYFRTMQDGTATTTIDHDIVFSTEVSPDQEQTLRDAAAGCPVSRLLEGQVTVRTFVERTAAAASELEYSTDEITVLWRPERCQHAQRCWRQLPQVFDPQHRPWTNPEGASAERIIAQVDACPSGALGYRRA